MHSAKILVPVFGSQHDRLALASAFVLGDGVGGHLAVRFVRADPEDSVPYFAMGGDSLDDLRENFKRRAEEFGKKAAATSRRHFNAICRAKGITKSQHPVDPAALTADWHEMVGEADDLVPEQAKFCDYVLFVGPIRDFNPATPNVVECTLLESGRPVLFAPNGLKRYPAPRVAIAWDASVQAVRAVGAALPILEMNSDIRIFSVDEVDGPAPDPNQLVEYLAWHGLESSGDVLPLGRGGVGEAILSASYQFQADLLVMGGFGHSRFKEIILGGTTMHALHNTKVPLFLMH